MILQRGFLPRFFYGGDGCLNRPEAADHRATLLFTEYIKISIMLQRAIRDLKMADTGARGAIAAPIDELFHDYFWPFRNDPYVPVRCIFDSAAYSHLVRNRFGGGPEIHSLHFPFYEDFFVDHELDGLKWTFINKSNKDLHYLFAPEYQHKEYQNKRVGR